MNLTQYYITENDCYKSNRTLQPKGVMVHSTAAPGVMAADFAKRWNKPGVEKAVHAFVDDGAAVWTMPWTIRGWHCGVAYEGGPSANSTHIAFEICEPIELILHYRPTLKRGAANNAYAVRCVQRQLQARGMYTGAIDGSFGPATESAVKAYQSAKILTADGSCGPKTWAALAGEPEGLCVYNPSDPDIKRYFNAAYSNAAELCAYLCALYGFDPLKDGVILCHSEGYQRRIASNHADVMHWLPLHGQNMDMFRYAVKSAAGKTSTAIPDSQPAQPQTSQPVLRKGSKGQDVRDMQSLLLKAGESLPKYGTDGSFGSETETAVKSFQKRKDLAVDGVCGPKTWAALTA